MSIKASVKEKSVIFVGPADTLNGRLQGAVIDKYDLVIRTNGGFDLADAYPEDYGRQCDILYINNFWFRANIKQQSADTQKQTLNRLLRGDIKFIILKPRSTRAIPDWLLKRETPKFIVGGRIPLDSKLRKLWTKGEKKLEPLQTTHAIHDTLKFKPKQLAITGIDFYEGSTSWHHLYNRTLSEEEHRVNRAHGHNIDGEKKFMQICLKKNLIKTDTKIKQLLDPAIPDTQFQIPEPKV